MPAGNINCNKYISYLYLNSFEGVPGFSYAISRRSALNKCEGNCRSLSLDLFDQEKNMEKTRQFRQSYSFQAFMRRITFYFISDLHLQLIRYWLSDKPWRSFIMKAELQEERKGTRTTEVSWRMEWLRWDSRNWFQNNLQDTS